MYIRQANSQSRATGHDQTSELSQSLPHNKPTMHTHRLLPLILTPTVLSQPLITNSVSPRAYTTAAPSCAIYTFPTTPINPPACWSWFDSASSTNYCTNLSIATSTTKSKSRTKSKSKSKHTTAFHTSCESLHQSLLQNPGDYFLADWTENQYNTFLTSNTTQPGTTCTLQVQPAIAPSSDQIYIGSTDITEFLSSAIATGQTDNIEGTMSCSGAEVQWRITTL
ncbi:hypothetical protein GGR57DRAFT_111299 [Xylariaceae sp. FL1272]|nr:hypothetical protein GGR57DRAFT_111299 [Xylariaceae sp. FL1272]